MTTSAGRQNQSVNQLAGQGGCCQHRATSRRRQTTRKLSAAVFRSQSATALIRVRVRRMVDVVEMPLYCLDVVMGQECSPVDRSPFGPESYRHEPPPAC